MEDFDTEKLESVMAAFEKALPKMATAAAVAVTGYIAVSAAKSFGDRIATRTADAVFDSTIGKVAIATGAAAIAYKVYSSLKSDDEDDDE